VKPPPRGRRRGLWLLWGILAGALPNPAFALTLNPNGVTPSIFSPNGDGVNDVVYFSLDNPTLANVAGKVLDCSGGDVADLAPAGAFAPTPDSLMWDGRDREGRIVRSGPYVFQIQAEGQVIGGVVVVVR